MFGSVGLLLLILVVFALSGVCLLIRGGFEYYYSVSEAFKGVAQDRLKSCTFYNEVESNLMSCVRFEF